MPRAGLFWNQDHLNFIQMSDNNEESLVSDPAIDITLSLHMNCTLLPSTANVLNVNPYLRFERFHVTFFERIESVKANECWKTGTLHQQRGSEGDWRVRKHFRESAFTVSRRSQT